MNNLAIKKISKLHGYKSFKRFAWDEMCIKKDEKKDEHVACIKAGQGAMQLFYGDNSSGKTSLCEILKSLFGKWNFEDEDGKTKPEYVEIEFYSDSGKDSVFTYKNGSWDKQPQATKALFFDEDFVHTNVHSNGGERSNEEGKHAQSSGKLVISVDAEAQRLDTEVERLQKQLNDLEMSFPHFRGYKPTEENKVLYEQYKQLDQANIYSNIEELEQRKKGIEARLEQSKMIQKKQALLDPGQIPKPALFPTLSAEVAYRELLQQDLHQSAHQIAEDRMRQHIQAHGAFIESGLGILNETAPLEQQNCPFCHQGLQGALHVIQTYKDFFNPELKRLKSTLRQDADKCLMELEGIHSYNEKLITRIRECFEILENLSKELQWSELYSPEKREQWVRSLQLLQENDQRKSIDMLMQLLREKREYKDINASNLTLIYSEIMKYIDGMQRIAEDFGVHVENVRNMLEEQRKAYSNENQITEESEKLTKEMAGAAAVIHFLQKDLEILREYLEKYLPEQTRLKENLRQAKEKLSGYVRSRSPVLEGIQSIMVKWDLPFALEHETGRETSTKDYAFRFKIVDTNGNERDLKHGLSSGERQVIALAFFLALLRQDQKNDSKTILVFDDPVTSLDSSNLFKICEYLIAECSGYAQTLIFTHHPLFCKFIRDACKKNGGDVFGIMKNAQRVGGSFIYVENGMDPYERLGLYQAEQEQRARDGSLNADSFVLQYGQLLRYALEKYIKYDLLMWDKGRNFDDILSKLKNKTAIIAKIEPQQAEELRCIYNYCNKANTSHYDNDGQTSLTELNGFIDRFLKVKNAIPLPC